MNLKYIIYVHRRGEDFFFIYQDNVPPYIGQIFLQFFRKLEKIINLCCIFFREKLKKPIFYAVLFKNNSFFLSQNSGFLKNCKKI